MLKLVILAACLSLSTTVLAADSNRIIKLEQDMRNLERQVGALQREVRELRQGTRTVGRPELATPSAEGPASSAAWLNIENWKELHVGASELEVIETLGAPTSMREENGARVLLYAMEIGSSGFLSGSVTLRNREVVEVQTPTLK
jgi:hypothetical protein